MLSGRGETWHIQDQLPKNRKVVQDKNKGKSEKQLQGKTIQQNKFELRQMT